MPRLPSEFPYRRRAWEELVFGPRTISGKSLNLELQRWIPNTHIKLREALCQLGEERISDWNGAEFMARRHNRPPDPPWSWRDESGQPQEYFTISDKGEKAAVSEFEAKAWWDDIEPFLISEWADEEKAAKRWSECKDLMRQELAAGRFVADVLAEDGKFYRIPEYQWRSKNGEAFLRSGVAEFRVGSHFAFPVKGPIVFEADFLETGKGAAESNLADDLGPETNAIGKADIIEPSKHPYLAFMIKAVREGPFSSDMRVPKKTIETWLANNWPPELGMSTPTKIATMATFLRRPQDEKGGIHKQGPER